MSREPCPLPSAEAIAGELGLPQAEAEALVARVQARLSAKRQPLTLIELLIILAIVAILAAILMPTFARCRYDARRSKCYSNAKQLSTALLMYASDYENQLPPAMTWHDAITPYGAGGYVFCPSRKEPAPSYSFNALLHLRPLKSIVAPPEQPMVFESMLGLWNASDVGASFTAPHVATGVVGYADGHVKAARSLPAPDAGLIRQRSKGPRKRQLP